MICFAILWQRLKDLEIFCIFLYPLFKCSPDCGQHFLSPLNWKDGSIFTVLLSEISPATPWSSNVLPFFFFKLGERLKSPLKIMPWGYFSLIPFRGTWKHMALAAQRVLMKQSATVLICRLHHERSHPAQIKPWREVQFCRNLDKGTVSQCRRWWLSAFERWKLLERLCRITSFSDQTPPSCKLVGHGRANVPL